MPGAVDETSFAPCRSFGESADEGVRRTVDAAGSERRTVVSGCPHEMNHALGKQDDNEFILLHVPELLKAR